MSKMTKTQPVERVAGPPVLTAANEHVFATKEPSTYHCRICSTPGATDRSDRLCWVCRRLKISAWQGTDAPDEIADE